MIFCPSVCGNSLFVCMWRCRCSLRLFVSSSHVVPYGFGSVRLRRELGRCLCTDTQDGECLSFCSVRTQTEWGHKHTRSGPGRVDGSWPPPVRVTDSFWHTDLKTSLKFKGPGKILQLRSKYLLEVWLLKLNVNDPECFSWTIGENLKPIQWEIRSYWEHTHIRSLARWHSALRDKTS